MSPRVAVVALLTLGWSLVACAPGHRYASSNATYLRFELTTAQHPESTARWYRCFEVEDAEYRQLCLSRTPGVRVSQGPTHLCGERDAESDLCRAFPLYSPEDDEAESSVDDDNAGAAIAEAFGRLFVGILAAAVDEDHDDDHDDDDDHDHDHDHDDERADRRSNDAAGKAKPARHDAGRQNQQSSRGLKR